MATAVVALSLTATASAYDPELIHEPNEARMAQPPVFNDLPTEQNEQFAPLGQPDYGASASDGSSERDSLNQAADGLASDVASKAAELTDDPTGQDVIRSCMAQALWDAAWNVVHGGESLGQAMSNIPNDLESCLGLYLGIGPVAATNISNWLMESVSHYASEAISDDPDVAGFVDWMAVTAWYSL